MFGVDGGLLSRQYKMHLSNYVHWKEEKYNSEFMLLKKNMGTHLSIDETSLSQGELYTIVTNKEAKGKKGSLVAIIRGVKSENVINVNKIDCVFYYLCNSLSLEAPISFFVCNRLNYTCGYNT